RLLAVARSGGHRDRHSFPTRRSSDLNSLTRGSLCGRWPDIGLWAVILSLSDRHGVVDMHPNAIAALTGLPADEVVACMERFCQRSEEHTSELQSRENLVCRLLLEKKN